MSCAVLCSGCAVQCWACQNDVECMILKANVWMDMHRCEMYVKWCIIIGVQVWVHFKVVDVQWCTAPLHLLHYFFWYGCIIENLSRKMFKFKAVKSKQYCSFVFGYENMRIWFLENVMAWVWKMASILLINSMKKYFSIKFCNLEVLRQAVYPDLWEMRWIFEARIKEWIYKIKQNIEYW
jgi:hypothetical protein